MGFQALLVSIISVGIGYIIYKIIMKKIGHWSAK
jgi:hypothetical protein